MSKPTFEIRRETQRHNAARHLRRDRHRLEEIIHANSARQALLTFARAKMSLERGRWQSPRIEWIGSETYWNGGSKWHADDERDLVSRTYRLVLDYYTDSGLLQHTAVYFAW